jgi:hypothetical protein
LQHQSRSALSDCPLASHKSEDGDLGELWLDNFFDKPWFHRVWTVQELVLSVNPILVCGDHQVPWRIAVSALIIIGGKKGYNNMKGQTELINSLPIMSALGRDSYRSFVFGKPEHSDIWPMYRILSFDFVTLIRTLDTFDHRDRIWGFLGVFQKAKLALPSPNQDNLKAQVFAEYTAAVMERCESPRIIYLAYPTAARSDVPSWVPDLSSTGSVPIHPNYIDSRQASKDSPFRFRIEEVYKCLVIQGKVVGTIQKVADYTWQPGNMTTPMWIMQIFKLWNFTDMIQKSDCTLSEKDIRECLLDIMTAFSDPEEFIPRTAFYRQWFTTFGLNVDKNLKNMEQDEIEVLFKRLVAKFDSLEPRYAEIARKGIGSMSYFMSDSNLCGKAGIFTRAGDILVLISGSPLPVVLRRQGDHYRYVSAAHVYGIMQGEIWDGEEGLEEFHIY